MPTPLTTILLLALSPGAAAQSPTPQARPSTAPLPPSSLALQVVQLQPTTPGTAQVGHVNVTGTLIAGSLQGNGAALTNLSAGSVASGTLSDARLSANVAKLGTGQTFTGSNTFSSSVQFQAAGAPFSVANSTKVANLNCDQLDGLDASAFLQSIPVPLVLAGGSGTVIEGHASLDNYPAVWGNSTAPNGGLGLQGSSTHGIGVYGSVNDGTGVQGLTFVQGPGVTAVSFNGDGLRAYSYYGGHAVHGLAGAPDSAVHGENAYGGPGVEGVATQGSNGVTGRADYPYASGAGVYGEHGGGQCGVTGRSTLGSPFGTDVGVFGETYGASGWAMFSNGRHFVNGDLFVAGAKAGCVTDIVKNGGNEPLETGDLVEIVGADEVGSPGTELEFAL